MPKDLTPPVELSWTGQVSYNGEVAPAEVYDAVDDIDFSLRKKPHRALHDMSGYALPARRLRSMGSGAASIILESLNSGGYSWEKPDHAYKSYYICATEDNVLEAADHLQDIGLAAPPIFFEVLERIADHRLQPALGAYVDLCYEDKACAARIKENRIWRAIDVALIAQQRTKSNHEIEVWDRFFADILETDESHGENIVSYDEIRRRFDEVNPDKVALNYANIFYTDVNDPYFGDSGRVNVNSGKWPLPEERAQVPEKLFNLANLFGETKCQSYDQDIMTSGLHEQEPHPNVASIGIEIEVEEPAWFSRHDGFLAGAERETRMLRKIALCRMVECAGLPAGRDEAWEFAHLPARDWRTLGQEVLALHSLGLLGEDYVEAPLHITLGGITTKRGGGGKVGLLAHALEATGWSTSARRIRRPIDERDGHWVYHARSNIHERRLHEIIGPKTTAVEFRVFSLQSLKGLFKTLRSAQMLGSALSVNQNSPDGGVASQKPLSELWMDFTHDIDELFRQPDVGLGQTAQDLWQCKYHIPRKGEHAISGSLIDIHANYLNLASFLATAENNPSSSAARFRDNIRKTVDEYTDEAERNLYPE